MNRCALAASCHCPEPVYRKGYCIEHWVWLCVHPDAKPNRREWVRREVARLRREWRAA